MSEKMVNISLRRSDALWVKRQAKKLGYTVGNYFMYLMDKYEAPLPPDEFAEANEMPSDWDATEAFTELIRKAQRDQQ